MIPQTVGWLVNCLEFIFRLFLVISITVTSGAVLPHSVYASKDERDSGYIIENPPSKNRMAIELFNMPPLFGENLTYQPKLKESYIKNQETSVPLLFVENVGQFDKRAKFFIQNSNSIIHFGKNDFWITVIDSGEPETQEAGELEKIAGATNEYRGVNLHYSFEGANPNPVIEGINRLETKTSYFIGNDSKKWHSNVPVWDGVRYVDLYPGVNLEITSQNGEWSWQLIICDQNRFNNSKKVGSHNSARLLIEGANSLVFRENRFIANTDIGIIALPSLDVIQDGSNTPIRSTSFYTDGGFEILSSGTPDQLDDKSAASSSKSTILEDSDATSIPSNLQEILIYSTFIGGFGPDSSPDGEWAPALWVNSNGEAYLMARTYSVQFPSAPGPIEIWDTIGSNRDNIYVSKIAANGNSVEFLTLIGGSSSDQPGLEGLRVDASGEIYITGYTLSGNFPNTLPNIGTLGGGDTFVVKLNADATSIVYSRLIGGSGSDRGNAIDISADGDVVVGGAAGIGFPLVEPSGQVSNADIFIAKFDVNGNILYSRSIGGTGGVDSAIDLEMDLSENIHVVSECRGGFPVTQVRYDGSYNGGIDVCLSQFSPDGLTLMYSTYIGGPSDDKPAGLALGQDGSVFVAGNSGTIFPSSYVLDQDPNAFVLRMHMNSTGLSYSTRFRVSTVGGIDVTELGEAYVTGDRMQGETVFLYGFSSGGAEIIYSVDVDGESTEERGKIFLDNTNGVFITGTTSSPDFPVTSNIGTPNCEDSFVMKFDRLPTKFEKRSSVTQNNPKNGTGDPRECPTSCDNESVQPGVGDPINTATGGFDYSYVDISLQTLAGPLAFQRSYSSEAIDLYQNAPLGYGWTHNQDTYLIFPDQPGGEVDKVWFKAHTGNQYRFDILPDGTFDPYPGVTAQLTEEADHYKLVDSGKNIYNFDLVTKKLTRWENAEGYGFIYTYVDGRLVEVNEPLSDRSLLFVYETVPPYRLTQVSDSSGEALVEFDYAGGEDLRFVSYPGVIDGDWEYVYLDHRMTEIYDPGSIRVVRNVYDPDGRVYQQYAQFDDAEVLIAEIVYENGVATIRTPSSTFGFTHSYGNRNTNIAQTDVFGWPTEQNFDPNFRVKSVVDQLGHSQSMIWSPDGANMTSYTDAQGHQVIMEYTDNQLTAIQDQLGRVTEYDYSGTLPQHSYQYLNGRTLTTTFEYTNSVDDPNEPVNLLKRIVDPEGEETFYEYYPSGELWTVTVGEIQTTYTYDNLGRIESTTDSSGNNNWACYNARGWVVRSVSSSSAPTSDPCDIENFIPRAEDLVTDFRYDVRGNQIASIAPNGQVTRTYYDDLSRVIATTQNLTNWLIETETPPTENLRDDIENIVAL